MCTVSFVASAGFVALTSNRDENILRPTAAAPEFHQLTTKKIIYPKDPKAGGTWFAASDTGVVAVLLNGAFTRHIAKPPYRKSRGLILLEIIESENPVSFFNKLDLINIEPFTIVLYSVNNLYELRWDGNTKYEKPLDSTGNYIWSSSTLYTEEVIENRRVLFEKFINSKAVKTAEAIRYFHGYNHGDDENGFVINRQTGIKTFSITQAVVHLDSLSFVHDDLLKNKQFKENMLIKKINNKNISEKI